MKNLKKILALVMVVAMMAALGVCAFAASTTQYAAAAENDDASITVKNSAMGETYTIFKLFDATVNGTQIAYTGDIPAALTNYFEKVTVSETGSTTVTYIQAKAKAVAEDGTRTEWSEEELAAAVAAWANTDSVKASNACLGYLTGTGTDLVFSGLDYGYYVIMSSQTAKDTDAIQAIVDSTTPNATVYEKSETTPMTSYAKVADSKNVSIGDTVTYTLSVNTSNFIGTKANAEQVLNYYVKDTLPAFLSNVTVTAIVVSEDASLATTADNTTLTTVQFDDATADDGDDIITVPWASNGTSLYKNGSTLFVTYNADVNDKITSGYTSATANADGSVTYVTENANTASFSYNTATKNPWADTNTVTDTEYLCTYSAVIQKIDSATPANHLAGAEFQAKGLTVAKVADGVYNFVSYNAESEDYSDSMTCNDDGYLIINGISSAITLTMKESKAPAGYNALDGTFTVTPVVAQYSVSTTKLETGTTYSWSHTDSAWTLNAATTSSTTTSAKTTDVESSKITAVNVINYTGAELPSTGGMGTTIFYVIGGILVLGAGILLVTKKRMAANG